MDQATLAVNEAYEAHRDYVLAVLRRRCGWLAPDEREAIFHDAYAVLLEKERDGELETEAMHGNQLRAYLTQTALFKALDEGKRAERNRSAPLEDAGAVEAESARPLEDSVSAEFEGARVREIVAELPRRRQAIVKLRFFFERTPAEIQDLLGVSSRVYRRELERAVKQIADRYELVREGTFCDSKRSLLLAYVAGVAGPGRAGEARAHLETCPGCASWAMGVRETTRRAAVILPLPALVGLGSRMPRVANSLSAAREHLAALVDGAKQQGASLSGRVDPGAGGYLGGTRPGTVAATVAGCIAIGGGAYCAVEGVPHSLSGLLPAIHLDDWAKETPTKPAAKPAAKRVVQAPPLVAQSEPVAEPEPKSPTHHEAEQTAHARENAKREAKEAAKEREFGPASVPATSSSSEYSEGEASSSSSETGYPAPSEAPAPPEETAGGAAEFAP